MAKHYPISPSAAKRVINCSASVELAAAHPELATESDAASEGTRAHDTAEWCARAVVFGEADYPPPDDVPPEMQQHAESFAEFVGVMAEGATCIAIENTIESKEMPGFGGTADFLAFAENRLYVVDFKYGFYPVRAENNPQLLCYALLAAEEYPDIEFDEVVLVIFQPRTPGHAVDAWKCDRSQLKDFARLLVDSQTEKRFKTGDHCRFCPAITVCPQVRKETAELAAREFGSVMDDPDSWGRIMEAAPAIKKLIAAIPARMLDAMKHGQEFDGWKAVNSWGNRVWCGDEAKIYAALRKQKINKTAATEKRLLSPAQVEKLGADVSALTTRPFKGVSLAPADDRRDAVVFESAEDTFQPIIEAKP